MKWKTAWKKLHKKGLIFALLILNAATIFAFGVKDSAFDDDFKSTLFTLRDLFSQQDDGAQDLDALIGISISGILIIILAFLAERLIVRLYWKHSIKNQRSTFELVEARVKEIEIPGLSKEDSEQILEECKAISIHTDFHTVRPANTYFIPPLVYRISESLDCPPEECAKNFFAALLYDSGFLEMEPELFRMEILNRKEKKIFRKHVIMFEDEIAFLPRELYVTCRNACYLHHENMDGSGYPENLKDEQIPLIARIIRVADSYTSLITKRTYHKRLTPRQAVQDLKRKSKIYDQKLVDILQSIV